MRTEIFRSGSFIRADGKWSDVCNPPACPCSARQSGILHGTLDAWRRRKFQNSFKVVALVFFSSATSVAAKLRDAAYARQTPVGKWLPYFARKIPAAVARFRQVMRLVACIIAQCEISGRQPFQLAAQTMELNIPRSGCGFSITDQHFRNSAGPVPPRSAVSAGRSGRLRTAARRRFSATASATHR